MTATAAPPGISIDVRGLPRPQGSMRVIPNRNGKGYGVKYPAGVYQWRGQVQQAVADAVIEQMIGPIELRLGFDLPRPGAHYGTGRNAGVVKASAPTHPSVMPDLDKLVRCVCDAITDAGLWRDDAQVVSIIAAKRYTNANPGVLIQVTEVQ